MLGLPTNVQIIIDPVKRNTAAIKFTKGTNAVKTEIDRFWVKGEGTFDQYTTGEGFYYEGLNWGTHCEFKLRSFDSSGQVVVSKVYSFDIEKAIVPTASKDVKVVFDEVKGNTVTIKFTKGDGIKTEIDKLWVGNPNSWDEYTVGSAFYLENLDWGIIYNFKLRTVSNDGTVALDPNIYSFTTPVAIVPTVPTNVQIIKDEAKGNTVAIKFTKGAGSKTEIDKLWVGSPDSWDEYTKGEGFYLENLEWGTHYEFKLRTVSNNETIAIDSNTYSFDVEAKVMPTPPTNVTITIDEIKKNAAYINFTKGTGIKTEIDKFWVNGQGTFDEHSTGNSFYVENLPWGQHCEFQLRTVANDGTVVVDPTVYTFDIIENSPPIAPSNIHVAVEENRATITFAKGNGVKTEICKSWGSGIGVWDEFTGGTGFYYEGLAYDSSYSFKLRTVSITGLTAESSLITFKTQPPIVIVPKVPLPADVDPKAYYDEKTCQYEEKWFFTMKDNGQTPGVTLDIPERFRKYGAYYVGDTTKKEIFLTFDEGYELGYTPLILDTLKANNVQASFFVTDMFLTSSPDLTKRMYDEGHCVCNHSTNHPSMGNVAKEGFNAFRKELEVCAERYRTITGSEINKFFRTPMGKFSELALAYANALEYKSIFWSFGYDDWNPNKQPDETYAKNYILSHTHDGMIILLHAVSKTNTNILDYLIKQWVAQGYTIKTLNYLV